MFATVVLFLGGCARESKADAVTFKIICKSENVYMLFYTMYLDGEYFCQGGFADPDDGPLTAESDLSMTFAKDYFEGRDISRMSFDFSAFGADDVEEIGSTQPVAVAATYGDTYVIEFSGNTENGYVASLTGS